MSAYPKVVNKSNKFNDEGVEKPTNIMFDKRVVRGNTYAAMIVPNLDQNQPRNTKKQPEYEDHKDKYSVSRKNEGTPEPVEGRKHISVDCIRGDDSLLKPVDMYDKPPDRSVDVQTDFFIDRPLTPRSIPIKTGIDVETQIWDGDLFNFNEEVEPMLQVIVGKTLEEARMEVLEEEELKAMKKHQAEFEKLRDSELMEAQRLEEDERRKEDEMKRRKQELSIIYEQKKLSHQKYVSRLISKAFFQNTKKMIFSQLQQIG